MKQIYIFLCCAIYQVLFGRRNHLATYNARTLAFPVGFIANGANAFDNFGVSVVGVKDVSGDNLDDLIIGANQANDFTGRVYVKKIFSFSVSFI